MKIKNLILLTIATLCCTALSARTASREDMIRKSARPLVLTNYQDSIQNGETYLFVDELINEVGEYYYTFNRESEGKPDSLIILTLKYLTPPCEDIEVTVADSIYEGDTYLFIDTLLTTEGTYTRTIPRVAGCDSTINLTLSFIAPPAPVCEDIEVAVADSIYEGDTYLFIDTLLTTAGTYTRTIPRVAGCDSTINLTLSFIAPPVPPCEDIEVAVADSIVEGDTYLFIDTLLTTAGTYTRTIPRVAGCDSTIALTLSLLPACSDTMVAVADSIYEGDTYLFIDTLLTTEGTYTRTIPRVAGCDSTINLTLSFIAPPVPICEDIEVTVADSIYEGDTYLFIDTLLTTEGTYTRTIPRVAGCDSTINLTLTFWTPCSDTAVAYTDSILVGEFYLFIDTLITMNDADTVTCQRTLPRVAGCDSTINLTLIAKWVYARDTLRDTINKDLCYKEAFTDRLGVTYYPAQDTVVMDTISDVKIDTVAYTITNYDSIYRYELKVWPDVEIKPVVKDTILVDSLPYKWKVYDDFTIDTIMTAGLHYDTVRNIRECDSIIYTLDLKIIAHDTTYAPIVRENKCDGDPYSTRLRPSITLIGHTDAVYDTIFRDTVKGCMITPLYMTDSVYEYVISVWPKTKYPEAFKDTIDEDKFPYMWNVYEGRQLAINAGGQHFDTIRNSLPQACDSIVYELQLAVRTVERREAALVDTNVCKGTEYQSRLLPTHIINGLTEWQDSLRLREGLTAIDSIYKYKVDTLPTRIPDDEITGIKAFCDYPVDYSYAWLNVAEFVNPSFIFAEVTDTIWEVETKNGWNPAATTIITSEDEYVRVRVTVVTECETTYSTSEPYEVKMATADDKEELTIPAAQKYGSRIIMIDRKYTTDTLGWTIPEADVTWYQVVDEPDDRGYDSDPATWNDKKVGEGQYYYNLDNGDPITGQYYAIVTGATKGEKMTCGVELRTPVLVCNQKSNAPTLAPNLVAPNESMTLSGLDATQNYTIRVIGLDGSAVNTLNVNGNEKINLKAAPVQGMYIVNVWNGQENVSLKYIVK